FEANALYGVKVEYEGDPELSLDEQLEQISEFEGFDWLTTVRHDFPEADWQSIELAYEEWNKKSTSLSPAAMALLTIVVVIATGGVGTTFASSIGATATSSSLGAAVAAGTTSMISQAAVAVANGAVNGD